MLNNNRIDHPSVVLRENSSSSQPPEILSATHDFSDDVIFKGTKKAIKKSGSKSKMEGNITKHKNKVKGKLE